MMTQERKVENVVNITDMLWRLNKYRLMEQIEQASGEEVPEECYKLMEWCFRFGAMHMEKALGKARDV